MIAPIYHVTVPTIATALTASTMKDLSSTTLPSETLNVTREPDPDPAPYTVTQNDMVMKPKDAFEHLRLAERRRQTKRRNKAKRPRWRQ